MQKSHFIRITALSFDRINRATRDRNGGHTSLTKNKYWKKKDRKINRRQQDKIKAQALLEHQRGDHDPCWYCGQMCDASYCQSQDEDMAAMYGYDLNEEEDHIKAYENEMFFEHDDEYDFYDPYMFDDINYY
jgi:hypothetical protein